MTPHWFNAPALIALGHDAGAVRAIAIQVDGDRIQIDRDAPEWKALHLPLSRMPKPSRGLGDTVAKAIKAVTFGKVKPCGGCAKRRDALNRIVPFRYSVSDRQDDNRD